MSTEQMTNSLPLLEQDKDNVFTTDLLPENLLEIIDELENKLNWNRDFCLLALLVVASGAIGSARISFIAGYEVKPILFGCLVGLPSVNKSTPLAFAGEPMFKIFNNLFDKYQAQMQEYNSLTADEKKEQKKPRFVEIVFNDITIEKVASNLQYNPKGATLIVDELKGFFNSFSMYNEGSNAEQKYLSLFNGSNLIDSRITRDTVVVSNPHLSIIGTTQPDVIYKTFNKATDNGMKERFLFVCPDAQPTKWSTYANKEIRAEIQEKWAKIINELFFLNTELWANSGKMKGVYIRFEREAEEILREWQADNVERQKKNLKSASMLGKADIICPRLALILSLIENPKTQIISSQNAYRAVNLMEYFIKHNHKVLQIIKNGTPNKPNDKRRLFDALPDNFTTAEAIDAGLNLNISKATVNRYLRDENFCINSKHGRYEKV